MITLDNGMEARYFLPPESILSVDDGAEVDAGTDPLDDEDFPAEAVPLLGLGGFLALMGSLLGAGWLGWRRD